MITLSATQRKIDGKIVLPSSKSESNRALIIQALCPKPFQLHNLSSARDTQTMIRLLASEGHVLDVIDAGTTMRFLTAYFTAVGRDQILTGTPRMCKRPIGVLVDALRELGGEILYWNQEGFPPLHIVSKGERLRGGEISIPGNVSSQFITALLLIGPTLEGGLKLHLTGKINSRSYIEMSLDLMSHFGVQSRFEGSTIEVPQQAYAALDYTIESDWSAASYWYSFVALSEEADIFLPGLRMNSRQGDKSISDYMVDFGVTTEFLDEGVRIRRIPRSYREDLSIDFTDTPDLAQTMAVVSAATGIPLVLSGLETLRVKETDRIMALQVELKRFGVDMVEVGDYSFKIQGEYTASDSPVHTYEDHRMAMAFAPLVLQQNKLNLKDQEVVEKSYPEFWKHLKQIGIIVTEW